MSPKPETVKMKHEYTQDDLPWRMDEPVHLRSVTANGQTYSWRLFHYLSGGCAQFSRTAVQEKARLRQRRFFKIAAACAVLWLLAIWL